MGAGERDVQQLDVTRGDVLHGLGDAAIGHMGDVDAGGAVEQLAGQVEHRADAGAAVGQLARIGLGVGDQVRTELTGRSALTISAVTGSTAAMIGVKSFTGSKGRSFIRCTAVTCEAGVAASSV